MEITNLSKDKNNLLERIFKLQKHNTDIKTDNYIYDNGVYFSS